MTPDAAFWTKVAPKYMKQPLTDPAAYAQTLERIRAHMPTGARVLELGCGTGGTALKLAPDAGHILAMDFADGMIAQAKTRPQAENVQFAVGDVFDARLVPGDYDVILALNLLHLMKDTPKAYARIAALLAEGGVFISKTPCIGERNLGFKFNLIRRAVPLLQWLGKAPFVRFLKIMEIEDEIAQAGFRIVETGNYPVRPANHFVVATRA